MSKNKTLDFEGIKKRAFEAENKLKNIKDIVLNQDTRCDACGELKEVYDKHFKDLKQELGIAEQKLKDIKSELSFIDNDCVWYNGKKAYMGDDLIKYLIEKILQILESEV